ncbi:MAG: hypothetical protein WKF31_00840 [Thermoleophilaceae bacterium]
MPWRGAGHHRGQVGGLPPTGRFVIAHGLHYLELSDGLVRRARGFFDLYDAAYPAGHAPHARIARRDRPHDAARLRPAATG